MHGRMSENEGSGGSCIVHMKTEVLKTDIVDHIVLLSIASLATLHGSNCEFHP